VNDDTLSAVRVGLTECPEARLTRVLKTLGIAPSTWYNGPRTDHEHKKPGPQPKPIPVKIEEVIVTMAITNPWYGYKRIAVMCRRAGDRVTNRQSYVVMKKHGLLQKPKARAAEIYQTAKLFELLPSGPNELWQMDVTYIHIPTFGWWYAVTVIDYYSRYLPAAYLTPNYSALAATEGLALARQEAERVSGPLTKTPFLVTDNGSTFIAKRFMEFTRQDYRQVRIRYRTPTQLGLLERFHRTTGVCTTIRGMRASAWPSFGRGITSRVLIGRWSPKPAVIQPPRKRSTRAR